MSKKILVADDDKDICEFIKKILERRGHKVSLAFDGLEAKSLIEDKEFDVMFLDCSMPDLTGIELINLAKKKSPNAKIFIFSGYSAMNGRIADDLGADKFLQKPLTVKMIEEAINI